MSIVFILIDDDYDDRELFKEALSEIDSTILCYCFGDGEEAIKKLDNNAFDEPSVMFVDINLPEMSGWEVLTKVKRSEQHKHIPVVMYSTSSHKRDKEIALDLGAICLITKPNNYKILKDILGMIVRTLDNNDSIYLIHDQIIAFS